jgi:hypothetical protein
MRNAATCSPPKARDISAVSLTYVGAYAKSAESRLSRGLRQARGRHPLGEFAAPCRICIGSKRFLLQHRLEVATLGRPVSRIGQL